MNFLENIDFNKILTNIVGDVGGTLPRILVALFILIVGWIIAKIISNIVFRLFKTPIIEKVEQKLKDIELFADIDFNLAKVLSKVVYWAFLLFVIIVSADVLDINSISTSLENLFPLIGKILVAVIIFLIGTFIANLIKGFITNTCEAMNIPGGRIIGLVVFYFLLVVFALVALQQAGIKTGMVDNILIIVLSGLVLAVGLGYGLSSKDLMSNMLGSFYAKDKFEVGQSIIYKGISGKITQKDGSAVTILKDNQNIVIIPLSKFVNEEVEIVHSQTPTNGDPSNASEA